MKGVVLSLEEDFAFVRSLIAKAMIGISACHDIDDNDDDVHTDHNATASSSSSEGMSFKGPSNQQLPSKASALFRTLFGRAFQPEQQHIVPNHSGKLAGSSIKDAPLRTVQAESSLGSPDSVAFVVPRAAKAPSMYIVARGAGQTVQRSPASVAFLEASHSDSLCVSPQASVRGMEVSPMNIPRAGARPIFVASATEPVGPSPASLHVEDDEGSALKHPGSLGIENLAEGATYAASTPQGSALSSYNHRGLRAFVAPWTSVRSNSLHVQCPDGAIDSPTNAPAEQQPQHTAASSAPPLAVVLKPTRRLVWSWQRPPPPRKTQESPPN